MSKMFQKPGNKLYFSTSFKVHKVFNSKRILYSKKYIVKISYIKSNNEQQLVTTYCTINCKN